MIVWAALTSTDGMLPANGYNRCFSGSSSSWSGRATATSVTHDSMALRGHKDPGPWSARGARRGSSMSTDRDTVRSYD